MADRLSQLRAQIRAQMLPNEAEVVARLAEQARLAEDERAAISRSAAGLVRAVRSASNPQLMEAFLAEYGLSTDEGIALMCLAEALLRIPDAGTRDALIRDKIAPGDWRGHLGGGKSLFVNAATWGLVVTGKLAATSSEAPATTESASRRRPSQTGTRPRRARSWSTARRSRTTRAATFIARSRWCSRILTVRWTRA